MFIGVSNGNVKMCQHNGWVQGRNQWVECEIYVREAKFAKIATDFIASEDLCRLGTGYSGRHSVDLVQ